MSYEDEALKRMNQIQLDPVAVEDNAESCARVVAGSSITSAADTELILDQLGILGILKARRADRMPTHPDHPLGRQSADLTGSCPPSGTPTPPKTKDTQLVDGYLGDVAPFDLNKTYYLAGPMTGYELYNYPAFALVCEHLKLNQIKVESPHLCPRPENWEEMEELELWQHMMKLAGEMLDRCEGIILMPGWPESRGARAELATAIDRKLPVYFFTGRDMICMNRRVQSE